MVGLLGDAASVAAEVSSWQGYFPEDVPRTWSRLGARHVRAADRLANALDAEDRSKTL